MESYHEGEKEPLLILYDVAEPRVAGTLHALCASFGERARLEPIDPSHYVVTIWPGVPEGWAA